MVLEALSADPKKFSLAAAILAPPLLSDATRAQHCVQKVIAAMTSVADNAADPLAEAAAFAAILPRSLQEATHAALAEQQLPAARPRPTSEVSVQNPNRSGNFKGGGKRTKLTPAILASLENGIANHTFTR